TGGPAPGGSPTAPAAPAAGGPKEDLLLGSIGTGSGPIGAQVAAIPIAVRAWAADVNSRGGLGGHRVRVIFGDDGGDPARALAIARQMVEQDGVLILFGNYGATTVQAVIPYLEERHIPLVGGMSANPAEDQSPMVFNAETGADLGTGRSFWTTVITLTKVEKVALLFCREAQVCAGGAARVREYAPVVKRQIVYEAQVSLAQPDFTAEVIAARNAGAEAFVGFIDFASWRRLISAAERQGWKPLFMGGPSVYDDQILQGDADLVEGLLGYGRTTPYADSPRMADYRAAVKRHVPGGFLADTGAAAWVNGKLLDHLVGLIGDAPVTREAILGALHGLAGETLGGLVPPLRFPEGAHGRVNLCTTPVQVRQGKWVAPLGPDRFFCALDEGLTEVVVR
ncbi:MAG: ABC transporter substrate-binding protein, partial [Acidimicrobiia bacterium]